jgi:DNA processing protein
VPDDRRSTAFGFPYGFGRGAAEADAVLLLRCLLGPTPRAMHALVWEAGSASLALERIRYGQAGSENDRRFLAAAHPSAIRRRLDDVGARFAAPGDPDYWAPMLRLADPPVGIFVRGRPLDRGDERVAIVGSRRPTATGREVAANLARGVASAGMITVSGGAFGIDAAAHRGALDAGGLTVAVLGSGIDVPHPAGNRALFARIESSGTLVSEYPPGVPAEPFRFPARNRLIAALSRGVVVVEGAAKSGTRITAEHAVELGLDVFAVPGPVTGPLAETPLALIREGATLVRGAEDLLGDLGIDAERMGRGPAPQGLSGDERRVFEALTAPMLPAAAAHAAGMSPGRALSSLIDLELRGLVRAAGGRFERTFRLPPGDRRPDGPRARDAGGPPSG